MKNDSKNIIKSQDGELIALKERKLFEKIGYSLRQLIIALLCNITKPNTSSSLFYKTKQTKQGLKQQEIDKKITDDILDDYIGEESIDKQRFVLIKEHFKKRVWFHGLGMILVPFFFLWLMFPIILVVYDPPSTSSFALFVDSTHSRPFFYASIFISSSVSCLFWRFYGLTWFLKGFEKDVIRYTLEKSLKKTDKNKVKSVGGIALQYYKEDDLDLDEVIKSLAKEDEGEQNNY